MTKQQSTYANSIHYYRRSEQISNNQAQYWLEQIRQQRKTKKEVDDVYNNFTKFINTLKANKKKKRESANRRRKLNAMDGPSPRR
jgi:N-glycosylase/DNA lyase